MFNYYNYFFQFLVKLFLVIINIGITYIKMSDNLISEITRVSDNLQKISVDTNTKLNNEKKIRVCDTYEEQKEEKKIRVDDTYEEKEETIFPPKWSDAEGKLMMSHLINQYEYYKKYPRTQEAALKWKYGTFKGVPLPKIMKYVLNEGPLIKQLPKATESNTIIDSKYIWDDVTYDELEIFLSKNYKKTDKYTVNYSKDFIKWALLGDYVWSIGIRTNKKKILCGVICARSSKVSTLMAYLPVVEIVFLVTKESQRGKGLSGFLVKELYRRARINDFSYGIYSSTAVVPKPFAQSELYHRYLSVEKMYTAGLLVLKDKEKVSTRITSLKIQNGICTPGFRKMNDSEIESVWKLFNKQNIFSVYPVFSFESFKQRFLNYPDIVHNYVVETITKEITDFVSYITYDYVMLPPYNRLCKSLKVALIYYTVFSTNNAISKILFDILYECHTQGIDIVAMYNTMENRLFITELTFESTNHSKFFGFVNWNMPIILGNQVGLASIE